MFLVVRSYVFSLSVGPIGGRGLFSVALVVVALTIGCGRSREGSDSEVPSEATPGEIKPREATAGDASRGETSGREASSVKTAESAVTTEGPKVLDLRDVSADRISAAIAEAAQWPGVEELIVSGEAIDDDVIAPLIEMSSLKRLKTEGTSIGDGTVEGFAEKNLLELLYLLDAGGLTSSGVKSLGRMTRLRNLRVSGDAVTDDSVAPLSGLGDLAALALHETEVGDEGLRSLGELTELRELSLFGTPVTDAGLETIGGMPRLVKLRLRQTGVTGEAAGPLAETSIEDLELAETEFSNAGMATVASMPRLTKLNLWLTRVDDDGVEALRGLERMTSLNLDNLPGVTDRSIDVINTLPNLEFLHLGKTGITPAGLRRLQGLPRLKTLHVTELGVSDEDKAAIRESLPAVSELVDGA